MNRFYPTTERSKPGEASAISSANCAAAHLRETFELFMDHLVNGVIITDPDGHVVFMNKAYGRFLGLDPKLQVGLHVTSVVENTRMHVVAKTGRPEINDTQVIRGRNTVVQRIPIRKDHRVVAVFGLVMFHCVKDLQEIYEKINLLESKVEMYEKELISLRAHRYTLESIVGESETAEKLRKLVVKAGANNLAVLITGESGSGKELIAQAIHNASVRRLHPFVRVNSSAIPSELLESELFGYDKGAFTGAHARGKPGKFQLAHHGTIFFDEIGDLPESMQPKLLRVLEEKEFERIGGMSPIRSDFRLIAATNRDLEKRVEEGHFRADLYYRINVFHLNVPPLRTRRQDILPQARHFIRQLAEEWGIPEPELSKDCEKTLVHYHWPGNSRELRHVLQRTMALLEGKVICRSDLPPALLTAHSRSVDTGSAVLREVLKEAEAKAIRNALQMCDNNKVKAAKRLGIHRTLLYRRMRSLGIASCG